MTYSLPILMCFVGVGDLKELERIGKLEHAPIAEASGIVASRKHEGIFWVHNDSGHPPALFAVKRDGTLVREYRVAAPNVDWEDIATDEDGHLYIGDIGNNGGILPIRVVYRIEEPDPSRPVEKPLPVTLASYYRFPQGRRFDAEGLFVEGKRAIVVAKTFDRREAELYAIPLDPPAPLLRPTLPERIGKLPGFTEPATGADLSADGRRLAVCSTTVVRVYEREEREWKFRGEVRYKAAEIEAVCWDGDDLILASESREMYRVAAEVWRESAPAITQKQDRLKAELQQGGKQPRMRARERR